MLTKLKRIIVLFLCFITFFCCKTEKKNLKTEIPENIDTVLSPSETLEVMINYVETVDLEVNPEYVYDYKKTKFVPPHGKTLFILGQNHEEIFDYLNYFSGEPLPSGFSSYWPITEFSGVNTDFKVNYIRTQNHQTLMDSFPNTVSLSGLWLVGKWGIDLKTANGEYDDVLKKFCDWAKEVDRPIYLRIGYEFDGPHNELKPYNYVKSYQYIVDFIRSESVYNIAFVWHSYAGKLYMNYKLSEWYPGDDYVDWVALSVFAQGYKGPRFGNETDTILKFAKLHSKPLMIAESSPCNGIEKEMTVRTRNWFYNYIKFIHRNNIKAVSFTNENWLINSSLHIPTWKDGRVQSNEKFSKLWLHEINKPYYLKQSPDLFEVLGYHRNK